MIVLSLNLSKIDKTRIKVADSGDKWVNLILSERKEVGKYKETHTLANTKTKEEREKNIPTAYCGSGIEYKPQGAQSVEEMKAYNPEEDEDDLPF